MKRLFLLALLLPLVGCSYALKKAEKYQDWRTDRKVEKAAEMADGRMVKIAASDARDLTLFTGTVAGPCRGLEARLEGTEPPDPLAAVIRDHIDRIYASKSLSEAEIVAGEMQDLLPRVEKATVFGGIHGGCLLPVTVAGDPTDPTGMIIPRRVLCPVGPIEASCKALAPPAVIEFVGGIVGADRVYYVPSGPIGGG